MKLAIRNILKKNTNKTIKPTIVIMIMANALNVNRQILLNKLRTSEISLYFILDTVVIAPSPVSNKKLMGTISE